MKVLVTGASGMLGSNLIPLLKEKGYKIVAMINKGSLRKRPWVREILSGVDVVEARVEEFSGSLKVDAILHLAAVLRGPTMRVNYEGTANILRRVEAETFVFISSVLALGDGLKEGANEETRCLPVTGYERSKCEAERAVLSSGRRAIVLRPGWIYGPYSLNPDILAIAKLVKVGIRPIFIEDELPLALVHARDVARAIIHLLENGHEGIYNVRGPRMYTMAELLDAISSFLGREGKGVRIPRHLVRLASRFVDVARYLDLAPKDVPIDKLVKKGFTPVIELKEGISESLEWARSKGLI